MRRFSDNTLDQLTEIYLYANTPSYLHAKMRSVAEIEWLGRTNRFFETEETIRRLMADIRQPNDLLTLYGLIVSLSYRPLSKVAEFLDELSMSDVDWVGRLAKHIRDAMIPCTVVDLRSETLSISSPLDVNSGGTVGMVQWSPSSRIETREM